MNFKLEICVDSLESAINAQIAGADRVELCDNLMEGGTTPCYGTIVSVRNNLTIGLHILIRPRGSDFLYTDPEFDIMRRDIEICGETGADGVVFGILLRDGNIDVERTSRLIEIARPMKVTFHRAFDMCRDPVRGLEEVILSGAERVLTSGQKSSAAEGSELIKNLIRQADNRIIIMPGGGINEFNITQIAKITGAHEFHLSGRKVVESEMMYRKSGISISSQPGISEFSRRVADTEKILNIINILKLI
ncbi:MAG: copper homeostasis protein CutC [Odoribacter sp.]|nr:copper homeostasis protein CutC [Odoribacter sp.]